MGTVMSRLNRARKNLRSALADVAAADDQQSLTAETPGNWAIMRGLAFLLDHAPILTGELT